MSRTPLLDALSQGRRLVSDGAWGTFLQAEGLAPGECPEMWNLEHPARVRRAAEAYVAAGADMIQSNSFGASRFKLRHFRKGYEDRVAEINEAAARISRQAAGEDRWVVASVGPTGVMLLLGDVTEDELFEGFAEQAAALERGGADAICIETMSALDEAALAVRAAREHTQCAVICTFTFNRTQRGDYRTMMGVSPDECVHALREAGADVVGTNCGNGIAGMVDIVREMRAADAGLPILVHANAGLPRRVDGRDVFPETPAEMAAQVPELLRAGANVVGGCCGTTPEHVRALCQAVRKTAVRGAA